MPLLIDPATVPADLRDIVAALGEEHPIVLAAAGEGTRVRLVSGAPAGELEVTLAGGGATVRYDTPARACRGLGAVLAGLPGAERTSFTTMGIMLDCSRNAVMTVAHLKRWLRRLALLGYNQAMLYTEETYELPGEEYFGYLRGRYSAAELTEIDAYAARLGIELVGCIQTLGHLEQLLKWGAYAEVKDTESVLLVDEAKTYALIEKMIAQYAACCRSRRIHVGMDETHDLGRGRFMDRHGYQRGYDLFNRHLAKVVEICRRHGLAPMIWSDMYFRMGSPNQDYYDVNCRIPDDVKNAIPAGAQLVYWDYYHKEEAFYADWIARHRALGREPVMASGCWTWGLPWYGRNITEATVAPCVAACRAAGLKEITFTLWGDDGAYCEFDSVLAGLAYSADLCCSGTADPARLQARFQAVCGSDYAAVMTACEMHDPVPVAPIFADDPLLRMAWKNHELAKPGDWAKVERRYGRLLARLKPLAATEAPVDFAHACTLLAFLRAKVRFNRELDAAYASRDPAALAACARRTRTVQKALDALLASFRRQWLRRNKPFGLETIQLRLGGQRQRYAEVAQRLGELIAGTVTAIPELDEKPSAPGGRRGGWRNWSAVGIL